MQKKQTNGEALRSMDDIQIALSVILWLSERMELNPAHTWAIWGDMILWLSLPHEPAPLPSWMERDEDSRE